MVKYTLRKKNCFAYSEYGSCRALNDCNCEKNGKICSFFKTDTEIRNSTIKYNERLVRLGYPSRKLTGRKK